MDRIYRHVGESIRKARLKKKLTLEKLAERAGLSASYVGLVERNAKKASLLTINKLATAMGVRVRSLFP